MSAQHIVISLCLITFSVMGGETKTYDLLAAAALSEGADYLTTRNELLNLGTNVLPFLRKAASDPDMTWQQRLVARIGYERLVRGADIKALREHDWRSYPPYQPFGKPPKYRLDITTNEVGKVSQLYRPVESTPPHEGGNILGRWVSMDKYVVPKCKDFGLWYYYLEGVWKNTQEGPQPSFDRQFDDVWPWFCVNSLDDMPEVYFFHRMMIDKLGHDEQLSDPRSKGYYEHLIAKKNSDALPVLVCRLKSYRIKVGASINTQSQDNLAVQFILNKIMQFADSRHAVLLTAYIDEHPELNPLREKLIGIEARPVPVSTSEPVFPPKGQEKKYVLRDGWTPVESFSPLPPAPVAAPAQMPTIITIHVGEL